MKTLVIKDIELFNHYKALASKLGMELQGATEEAIKLWIKNYNETKKINNQK